MRAWSGVQTIRGAPPSAPPGTPGTAALKVREPLRAVRVACRFLFVPQRVWRLRVVCPRSAFGDAPSLSVPSSRAQASDMRPSAGASPLAPYTLGTAGVQTPLGSEPTALPTEIQASETY